MSDPLVESKILKRFFMTSADVTYVIIIITIVTFEFNSINLESTAKSDVFRQIWPRFGSAT